MPDRGISSLAAVFNHMRTATPRSGEIFGVAVHQTGSSIAEAALKHGADPLEYTASFYLDPDNYFPHYVVGYDGEIVQVANETEKALHVGFLPADHQAFLDGSWVNRLPPEVVAAWQRHWPGYKSPAHVFPGASPNEVYIGVECIPLVDGVQNFQPASWLPQGQFTEVQHEAVVKLCLDIGQRNALPKGWHLSARLTTHEDLNPLERTTKVPPAGWDPGWLRDNPWFDLGWVRMQLDNQLSQPVANS